MNNNCSCCSWLMGLFLVVITTAFFAGMSKSNKCGCNKPLTYTVECIDAVQIADTIMGDVVDVVEEQDILSRPENYSDEHIQYVNDIMSDFSIDTLSAEDWKVDIVGFFN